MNFYPKNKIWEYEKKAVPLHSISRKIRFLPLFQKLTDY